MNQMYKSCPARKYCRRPMDWIPWTALALVAIAAIGLYTVSSSNTAGRRGNMSKLCAFCRNASDDVLHDKNCAPCYYATDDAGNRTKPNFQGSLYKRNLHNNGRSGAAMGAKRKKKNADSKAESRYGPNSSGAICFHDPSC